MASLGLTISTGGKNVHYMPKEREDIGKRIFTHEITKKEAAEEYGVSEQPIVNYVREYMKANKIPVVPDAGDAICIDMPDYAQMTKEQLISVIMKKDIEVARAKKDTRRKKGGKDKEFASISDANTK